MSNAADDSLMAELSTLTGRTDPLPASLRSAALGAIAFRTPGAHVADLTHDSALDDSRGSVRSGAATQRLLAFEAGDLSIEVEVERSGTARRIVGQVVPPARLGVVIRHPRGEIPVAVDELGRFAVGGVPAGPVSVRCEVPRPGGADEVVTAWVPI
ncbi:MAG TPA: hypothetical protein VFO60_06550 [Candidatus Dormibacteraeota bacterium]|nr:hypothetical protein [Candidatus Dormibacteraeota bacterium]